MRRKAEKSQQPWILLRYGRQALKDSHRGRIELATAGAGPAAAVRRLRKRSADCHQRCEATGREAEQRASDQADRARSQGQRRIGVVRASEPAGSVRRVRGGVARINRWQLHGGGPSGCVAPCRANPAGKAGVAATNSIPNAVTADVVRHPCTGRCDDTPAHARRSRLYKIPFRDHIIAKAIWYGTLGNVRWNRSRKRCSKKSPGAWCRS
jgi:hypothetical protein